MFIEYLLDVFEDVYCNCMYCPWFMMSIYCGGLCEYFSFCEGLSRIFIVNIWMFPGSLACIIEKVYCFFFFL